MFQRFWLSLLCFTMFVMSACSVGGTDEVIVTRTIQLQETPLTAAETIELTAVSQQPDPTATPTPSPTNTATPSPTPTLTPTAPPTATPTALPLTTHSWDSGPVLIEYNSNVCTDACYGLSFSALPTLILYSDGTLIINRYDRGTGYRQLESKVLTRGEVCKLLNTIDLIGFLDYDPARYYQQLISVELIPSIEIPNYIHINAWKSNEVNAVGIRYFMAGGFYAGEIELDTPLLYTFELLNNLRVQPLEPYVPERIIVSVDRIISETQPEYVGPELGEWPLTDFSLQSLFEMSGGRNFIVEDEEEIVALSNLFLPESTPLAQIYTENGQRYELSIRPLLPYETLESIGSPTGDRDIIPGPDLTPATTPMTCTPEDGVVDLYYLLVAGD